MSRRKTKGTSEYQLESNLKNKPNAQGTLFSGGELSDERYVKGYTPDRMRETRGQFVQLGNGFRRHLVSTPEGMGTYRQSYDRLMQNYARSDIDFSGQPVTGVSFSPTKPGYTGSYQHEGATKHGKPEINLTGSSLNNYVPIHEYGHHTDRDRVSGLRYQDDKLRGVTEGYADQYAENNYRTPQRGGKGGNQATIMHNPGGWFRGYQINTPGRQHEFSEGYEAGRREGGFQSQQAPGSNFEQGTLF